MKSLKLSKTFFQKRETKETGGNPATTSASFPGQNPQQGQEIYFKL